MSEEGLVLGQKVIKMRHDAFLERLDDPKSDEAFHKAVESYSEETFGPRFQLPMACYIRNTPLSYKDCLRFRVWFKPPNGGDSRCSEHLSIKGAQEKQIELEGKGYRVEPVIIGVFWDNAVGCFGECQIKELQ